jgi:hypothetical protein
MSKPPKISRGLTLRSKYSLAVIGKEAGNPTVQVAEEEKRVNKQHH